MLCLIKLASFLKTSGIGLMGEVGKWHKFKLHAKETAAWVQFRSRTQMANEKQKKVLWKMFQVDMHWTGEYISIILGIISMIFIVQISKKMIWMLSQW